MSKPSVSSLKYRGSLRDLRESVISACKQMSLKIKTDQSDDNHLHIQAAEKMRWMTTNWPVSFEVTSQLTGRDWAVIVTAGSGGVSITQDSNNAQKAEQLASLISALEPSLSDTARDLVAGASEGGSDVVALGGACPACQRPLHEGAKFCAECGAVVPPPPAPSVEAGSTCPDCGQPTNAGDKYCHECGSTLA